MRPKKIELHIEELVLHGFSPGDRHSIAQALEGELARLLEEQQDVPHLLEKSGEIEGIFEMTERMRPEAVGIGVAKAIHSGLNRENKTIQRER